MYITLESGGSRPPTSGEALQIRTALGLTTADVILTGQVSDLLGLPVPIVSGGTGATTAADALFALGLTNGDGNIEATIVLEEVAAGVVPDANALGLFDGSLRVGDGAAVAGQSFGAKRGVYKITTFDGTYQLLGSLVIPADRVATGVAFIFDVSVKSLSYSQANAGITIRPNSLAPDSTDRGVPGVWSSASMTRIAPVASSYPSTSRWYWPLKFDGGYVYAPTANAALAEHVVFQTLTAQSFGEAELFGEGSEAVDWAVDIWIEATAAGAPSVPAFVVWTAELLGETAI